VLSLLGLYCDRPGFYTTFWQLSTYDLSPPLTQTDEEVKTLRALGRQEDSRYNMAERSSDRSKRASAYIHRQRRERYNQFADRLTSEIKLQLSARTFTSKRLANEKQHWFAHRKLLFARKGTTDDHSS
jgi:THO complex subunit 2